MANPQEFFNCDLEKKCRSITKGIIKVWELVWLIQKNAYISEVWSLLKLAIVKQTILAHYIYLTLQDEVYIIRKFTSFNNRWNFIEISPACRYMFIVIFIKFRTVEELAISKNIPFEARLNCVCFLKDPDQNIQYYKKHHYFPKYLIFDF